MLRKIFEAVSILVLSVGIQAETLTSVQDPWPPFIQDGPEQGVSVDILRAALATQGYALTFKIMPWSRALNEVKNGNIDILPATWFTEERTEFLIYSEPYMANKIAFIKRANDVFEYDGLESLSGKKVGVVRGYGYGDAFLGAENFVRPEADNVISNVKKLLSGRIDLTLDDEIVTKSVMRQNGIDINLVAFTENALSVNDLYVTSGVANAKGQQIIDAYNAGLKTIISDGTFNKILSHYGVE